MDYSIFVWGLILIIIGILVFLYAEKLRRKNEIDMISIKFYIGAFVFIYIGFYYIFKEFF